MDAANAYVYESVVIIPPNIFCALYDFIVYVYEIPGIKLLKIYGGVINNILLSIFIYGGIHA